MFTVLLHFFCITGRPHGQGLPREVARPRPHAHGGRDHRHPRLRGRGHGVQAVPRTVNQVILKLLMEILHACLTGKLLVRPNNLNAKMIFLLKTNDVKSDN